MLRDKLDKQPNKSQRLLVQLVIHDFLSTGSGVVEISRMV
jgi:hypothetical protein